MPYIYNMSLEFLKCLVHTAKSLKYIAAFSFCFALKLAPSFFILLMHCNLLQFLLQLTEMCNKSVYLGDKIGFQSPPNTLCAHPSPGPSHHTFPRDATLFPALVY